MFIGFLLSEFKLKGGVERVSANLAAGLAERGHQCTLFYPYRPDSTLPYQAPESVRLHALPTPPINSAWLDTAKRSLRDAHLDVLCFMSNGSPFGRFLPYLCQDMAASFVWSEHCSPEHQKLLWNPTERTACLALTDAIHVLTPRCRALLPAFLQERTIPIPNFSALAGTLHSPTPIARGKKRLLAVARLSEEKQIPLLLQAFSYLKEFHKDWDCRICGDGPGRRDCEELIQALDLQEQVSMAGAVENITAEYSSADLFCLPSRYESFGLALVEAQGFGLPGVGFAQCAGVNEIIVHGENGLLAPEMTAESLAQTLRALMTDEKMRLRMKSRAHELFARYEREYVLDQWETLFARANSGYPHPSHRDKKENFADSPLQTTLHAILAKPLQVDRQDWKRVFAIARARISKDPRPEKTEGN